MEERKVGRKKVINEERFREEANHWKRKIERERTKENNYGRRNEEGINEERQEGRKKAMETDDSEGKM